MKPVIAIHPDDYTAKGSPPGSDASSPRWAEGLAAAGCEIRWVDVRANDILTQLEGCHALMWRWAHFDGMGLIARRLLPVVERELGLLVYPSQRTSWHYDDKIAQAYLLAALGLDIPRTDVFFDRDLAQSWANGCAYPQVLKLASGAGSENVKLVRNVDDAKVWIERLFDHSVTTLDVDQFASGFMPRARSAAAMMLGRRSRVARWNGYEPQAGYALFQEFLDGNAFDTRITIIGNRAFGFRRFNRPDDFRASGSGNIDYDHEAIDPEFVRLGFRAAERLGSQSVAIDGLYRSGAPVIGEVSYTYVSAAVHACPGHWVLDGAVDHGELRWVAGQMWPETAQIEGLLEELARRGLSPGTG